MNTDNKKTETKQCTIPSVSSCFDFEMSSLNQISRNVPTFKRDNHDVTPNWLIELKSNFKWKNKYGFILAYKSGYFFWVKRWSL